MLFRFIWKILSNDFLEYNIEMYFYDFGLGKDYLRKILKDFIIKEKIDKLDIFFYNLWLLKDKVKV